MSTKIYNGYKLKAMSMREFQEFTMRLREALRPVHEKMYYDLAARICCNTLDSLALDPPEMFMKRLQVELKRVNAAWCAWEVAFGMIREYERQIKVTGMRDPSYDFTCEIAVIPIQRKTLMLLYTEREEYRKVIESFPEVTQYPYWDNTDRPEDLSEASWKRRKRTWDEAVGHDVPAMRGFTVNLVNPNLWPEIDTVLSYMPKLEQRVMKVAKHRVLDRYAAENYAKEHPYKSAFQAFDFIRTEEGKALVQAESERIRKLLKPSYEREDLLQEFVKIRPELADVKPGEANKALFR